MPNLTANPPSPHETMTAFIAATGKGDVPDRHVAVQDDLRRRRRRSSSITLVMNLISIRFVRKYRQVYE